MMKLCLPALFLQLLVPATVQAGNTADRITIIDDAELSRNLQLALEKYADSGEGMTADKLSKEVKNAPQTCDARITPAAASGQVDQSVYLIGSVYHCGKCDKWHSSGTASAWAVSQDGLMVTNYHVIENAKGEAMAVCGIDGKVHRVTGILAADKANDIAVFRVDSKTLKTLPIGAPAPVGTPVKVVSHPESRLFTHTFGHVSRYSKVPGKTDEQGNFHMSITADYAKGSSGGPVLNGDGEVVGMVSSTKSIYYRTEKKGQQKDLQMVVKTCVPVAAISAMFPEEQAPAGDAPPALTEPHQ